MQRWRKLKHGQDHGTVCSAPIRGGQLRPLRSLRKFSFVGVSIIALGLCSISLGHCAGRAQSPTEPAAELGHTDPLNLDPLVRDGYLHFYTLDYDGAISRFESVLKEHPQDPMAYGYLQMATVFRELYHQDLLDTTYYAHDSFLNNKRSVPIPEATRDRIEELTNTGIKLADDRIKANPDDKDAYFARGYLKGIHAVFITLVDHSFVAAARQGLSARTDSEQALKIDALYTDAKMAIGIQQFAAGSLPRFVRMLVGVFGAGGNKERGLNLLRDCAAHGTITSVESRTVLSLFLRHDGRYPEALAVQHGLSQEFPHNYLFRLEEANLTKDEGNGSAAIILYKQVLADAAKRGYFIDARQQLAWFGLADTQRGQNDFADAAENYLKAVEQPKCSDWMKKRAYLNAGEMFDLTHEREKALDLYRQAAAPGGDQSQADMARKLIQHPYQGK